MQSKNYTQALDKAMRETTEIYEERQREKETENQSEEKTAESASGSASSESKSNEITEAEIQSTMQEVRMQMREDGVSPLGDLEKEREVTIFALRAARQMEEMKKDPMRNYEEIPFSENNHI